VRGGPNGPEHPTNHGCASAGQPLVQPTKQFLRGPRRSYSSQPNTGSIGLPSLASAGPALFLPRLGEVQSSNQHLCALPDAEIRIMLIFRYQKKKPWTAAIRAAPRAVTQFHHTKGGQKSTNTQTGRERLNYFETVIDSLCNSRSLPCSTVSASWVP
jgi:hypothetical protein